MSRKILLMMPRIYRGGAETQFRYFVKYYAERGNQIIVAIENCYNDESENEYICELKKYAQVIKLNWNYLDDSNKPIPKKDKIHVLFRAYKDIYDYLIHNSIDAIVSYSRMSIILTPVFLTLRIPYLFSERNTGESICKNKLYRILLKYANYIFTNSDAAYRKYKDYGFKNLGVVHNGIDCEQYLKHKYVDSKELKILIPARICPVKNQKIVIEAVRRINNDHWKLDFAGKIEDRTYYNEIKALCEEAKLNNVRYIGFLPDMKSVYAKYDLVILPSFEEGMPNVLLEAIASNVMTLYSDIEMNMDIMNDSHYSFNPNSPEELYNLIEGWFGTETTKKVAIVERIKNRILVDYSMQHMAQGIEKCIESSLC